jgi:hypothetical protein
MSSQRRGRILKMAHAFGGAPAETTCARAVENGRQAPSCCHRSTRASPRFTASLEWTGTLQLEG